MEAPAGLVDIKYKQEKESKNCKANQCCFFLACKKIEVECPDLGEMLMLHTEEIFMPL